MTSEEMASRVDALADAVEDRFGGFRADMSTGGSLSVKDVCDMLAQRLRSEKTDKPYAYAVEIGSPKLERVRVWYGLTGAEADAKEHNGKIVPLFVGPDPLFQDNVIAPFLAMADDLLERNWNASDIVMMDASPSGRHDGTSARLTAGDFFALRAAKGAILAALSETKAP